MKKNQRSLNNKSKGTPISLNAKLTSEINEDDNKEEKSNQENNLIHVSKEKNLDKKDLRTNTDIDKHFAVGNNEPIPVAYRILKEEKSLLDRILTPWGMFSIILFILANGIVFINFEMEKKIATDKLNTVTKEKVGNTDNESNISWTEKLTLEQDAVVKKDSLTEISPSNIPTPTPQPSAINQNPPTINQNPPTINQNPSDVNQNPSVINQNSLINTNSYDLPKSNPYKFSPVRVTNINLYPDLVTAILSNLNNFRENQIFSPQKVFQQDSVALPPPPPTTQIPKTVNKPTQNLQYIVLTDYKDIEYLEKIQFTYQKALTVTIGNQMKIQLGVFNNEQDARNFIEMLKSQQINAYIYSTKLTQN